MAIVNCGVCGKKISSKAASCNHCDAKFTDGGDIQNLESAKLMQKMRKSSQVQTISFVSVIVFIIGIIIWYFEIPIAAYMNKNWGTEYKFGEEILSLAKYILAVGFVGYVGSRFWSFYNKKK